MIRVEKIIPGGQALGTDADGKKIFFWNALPEETVSEYRVTKNKSHFTEAVALQIINPSKFRVNPKDDCFLSTSPWQIIDYDYELELKQSLVVEFFREHQIDLKTPEIFTDFKDYFYRNKMEYSLYYNHDTEKIELCFHARGSHRKIPIKQSSIERPEIFQAAQKIADDLNSRHEEARKYQSLLLRCNQAGEVSGGLYENHQPHPTFENLTDEILGKTYSYSPNGFFQVNLPVYEMTLKEIKKHINTEKVLDLYAGVGTIGLSVAPDKLLTLVEVDKFAFSELEKNCSCKVKISPSEGLKLGQAPLSGPEEGDIFTLNPILAKSEEALNYVDLDSTVILDPPRAGCDKKLINRLNEVKPETIIYLSCNPATQARDTKLLLENYKIKDVKIFNFFPHTPHIENLVIFQKI
ncbi:class I SAM-dependent RNA methyltransferase [Candidatus Saccharibacteria bacterium]|nr:class I SAM-dependent RNA methyltransferase [Candidatus Saccharibacteria bacterium]MBR3132432.1 class I SAM-dependent RNA methyltransferase [Candidatus Saccharibacteria bacterium]